MGCRFHLTIYIEAGFMFWSYTITKVFSDDSLLKLKLTIDIILIDKQ